MNAVFKFTEKPYSLRTNWQFKEEDRNDKIWHRSIEDFDIESFSK